MGRPGSGDGPLVSVVVPVFNAECHLRESLDSILAQSYPNLEVVVTDDASRDGSVPIARSYGGRVRLLRHDVNVGQFPNVERGIREARGELICVFHADDVYHPEIVEREVAFLQEHPEVGLVFCLDISLDADGKPYARTELPLDIEPRTPLELPSVLRGLLLHKNGFLRTPGAMVRAFLYGEVGPFRSEEFGYAADLDMWLRLARRRPVAILDEHLFGYRHTAESVAHSYKSQRRELDDFFRLVEVHLEETGYRPTVEEQAAFRAHVAEDRLLLAAGDYPRGDLERLRERLTQVRLADLLGSNRIQRVRLSVLLGLLHLLSHLPRIPWMARVFRRRWCSSPGSSSRTNRWAGRSVFLGSALDPVGDPAHAFIPLTEGRHDGRE